MRHQQLVLHVYKANNAHKIS